MERSVFRGWSGAAAKALVSAAIALLGLADGRLAASAAEAAPGLTPLGSIPLAGVEGRLDHLAVDVRGRRLFVAGLENHSVEVVDLARRRRIRELTGVNEPQGLVFVPERNRLFICFRGDGTCRSFDATTLREGPWLDVGRNADNARFDPASQCLYIGSGGEPGPGRLTAIDLVSLLPTELGGQPAPPHSPADFLLDRPRQADAKLEMELPGHPESFHLDPATHRVLVNVPDEHKVFVINVATNGLTVATTWPVTIGEKNFPMAFDAGSRRMFLACRRPALVAAYDADAGTLLAQAPCVGDADDLFYDAASRRLYVIGGEGFVDVFSVAEKGAELTRLAHAPTAPRARTGLLIPELHLLVVAAPRVSRSPAAVLLFQTKL